MRYHKKGIGPFLIFFAIFNIPVLMLIFSFLTEDFSVLNVLGFQEERAHTIGDSYITLKEKHARQQEITHNLQEVARHAATQALLAQAASSGYTQPCNTNELSPQTLSEECPLHPTILQEQFMHSFNTFLAHHLTNTQYATIEDYTITSSFNAQTSELTITVDTPKTLNLSEDTLEYHANLDFTLTLKDPFKDYTAILETVYTNKNCLTTPSFTCTLPFETFSQEANTLTITHTTQPTLLYNNLTYSLRFNLEDIDFLYQAFNLPQPPTLQEEENTTPLNI